MVSHVLSLASFRQNGKIRRMNIDAAVKGRVTHVPSQCDHIYAEGLDKGTRDLIEFFSGGESFGVENGPFYSPQEMESADIMAEIRDSILASNRFAPGDAVGSITEDENNLEGR